MTELKQSKSTFLGRLLTPRQKRIRVILPSWFDYSVIPLINILVAIFFSGLVIAVIGENPFEAMMVMVKGAFIYDGALGYTLYYTTNFIFTGLAVAVAFQALLFNIGGEGQATMGGLGVAMSALILAPYLPPFLVVIIAILMAAMMGAFWGIIPGWLQAKRGSHIVITTIMFNFIAASLMVALLSGPLLKKGQIAPESDGFADGVAMAKIHELTRLFGLEIAETPFNISFFLALIIAFLVWIIIWRTRFGYALRTLGASEGASIYAGQQPDKVIIIAMAVSGGIAGMMALNEVLGVQHRLVLDFSAGYGFTGIAVALIGRNHPVGILLASLLFGALYQGGTELDFNFQTISREMVLLIQGLIILFAGALSYMFNPWLEQLYASYFMKKGKT